MADDAPDALPGIEVLSFPAFELHTNITAKSRENRGPVFRRFCHWLEFHLDRSYYVMRFHAGTAISSPPKTIEKQRRSDGHWMGIDPVRTPCQEMKSHRVLIKTIAASYCVSVLLTAGVLRITAA
jgi:hypothetical protein